MAPWSVGVLDHRRARCRRMIDHNPESTVGVDSSVVGVAEVRRVELQQLGVPWIPEPR